MPGICTSSRMHAKSMLENPLQRFLPRVARDQRLSERLENGFEREQVLGAVVDEQELDALVCHASLPATIFATRAAELQSAAAASVSSGRTSAAGRRGSQPAGMIGLSAVFGSCTMRESATLHDVRQSTRAVFIRSRQHDTDRRRSISVGGRR